MKSPPLELAYAEREQKPFFDQLIRLAKSRESYRQRYERVAEDVDVALVLDASSDFGARDVGMADAFIVNNGLPSQSLPPSLNEGELKEVTSDEEYDMLALTQAPSWPVGAVLWVL